MKRGIIKEITITIFAHDQARKVWMYDFEAAGFADFLISLTREMKNRGVSLRQLRNREAKLRINSYADLLNVVKISSPVDCITNHCVGHILGISKNLDILEDITAAVKRIAFAPETIAPDGEFRKVCHNCGCGC
jgi:hypothetical protein